MGMILLSAEESKKNTFEGNKWMFLGSLDEKVWREFLNDFNQETKSETLLENFKEELWKNGSEARGTHLDGQRTGQEGKERDVWQDGQTERSGAED